MRTYVCVCLKERERERERGRVYVYTDDEGIKKRKKTELHIIRAKLLLLRYIERRGGERNNSVCALFFICPNLC